MRGPLLVFLGAFGVLFAGCSSACLFVVGFETATHPQSPLRHWPMKPGESVKDEVSVDQTGYGSRDVSVELALYEGPYKTVPIACTLHVQATRGTAPPTTHAAEAPVDRPASCSVSVDAAGPTRLVVDAKNLSERNVTLSVTPALPGFPRTFKLAWLALGAVALVGAVALRRGVRSWRKGRTAP